MARRAKPPQAETAVDAGPPAGPPPIDPQSATFADPSRSIGYQLRLAFRAFSRALERRTIQHGVSSGQWRFLRQIWVEEGLTQRELSRRVGMREPTTVVAVNGLERAGLVRRAPSEQDRRKIHIYLTPKGRALEAELLPLVAEVQARATRGLNEAELAALLSALNRVRDNLGEDIDWTEGSADDSV